MVWHAMCNLRAFTKMSAFEMHVQFLLISWKHLNQTVVYCRSKAP